MYEKKKKSPNRNSFKISVTLGVSSIFTNTNDMLSTADQMFRKQFANFV